MKRRNVQANNVVPQTPLSSSSYGDFRRIRRENFPHHRCKVQLTPIHGTGFVKLRVNFNRFRSVAVNGFHSTDWSKSLFTHLSRSQAQTGIGLRADRGSCAHDLQRHREREKERDIERERGGSKVENRLKRHTHFRRIFYTHTPIMLINWQKYCLKNMFVTTSKMLYFHKFVKCTNYLIMRYATWILSTLLF